MDGAGDQLGIAGDAVPAHCVHDSLGAAGFLMVHRKEGLDGLFFAAKQTLLEVWMRGKKGVPGIIAVMHTFGGDLKWNPHVHCIVTCGGLLGEQWRWMMFVPYRRLRSVWKYNVVDALRTWGKGRYTGDEYRRFNRWLDALYRKEWYVHVGKRLDSLEYTVKYIGRYAKRPVIAETRLKSFDGETVTVSHKDKVLQREVMLRLPVSEFIGKVVRHIPEKHHRMIRYSGLFASRVKAEKLGLVWAAMEEGGLPITAPRPVRSWRERIWEWTGVDPYRCSCGKMMRIVELVIATRGGGWIRVQVPP